MTVRYLGGDGPSIINLVGDLFERDVALAHEAREKRLREEADLRERNRGWADSLIQSQLVTRRFVLEESKRLVCARRNAADYYAALFDLDAPQR